MKVLFATTNPAKIKNYKEELNKNGIELITIKDLDFDIEINENGKNALENAFIKAKTYYDATGIVSIGMDNNLFIEGLQEEKQPGTHVRRVNGKRLTDEEMIEYYTGLVRENGGDLISKWVYGMVIYDGIKKSEFTWSKGNYHFLDKACEKINEGYPLDSIAFVPKYNKYLVELTQEEKSNLDNDNKGIEVINFIVNSLKK